jgi:hypothetical protein
LVGGEPIVLLATFPELARCGPEHLSHRPVELAKAAEPSGEGHLRDRQVGVVEQAPGEVRTT